MRFACITAVVLALLAADACANAGLLHGGGWNEWATVGLIFGGGYLLVGGKS